MAKFTEDQLNNFRFPPSDTEETKLGNAQRLIKDAIANSDELKEKNTRVFGQGSYANDTNVKNNSDIDINVRLSDTVFIGLPPGSKQEDFGYTDSDYTYAEYKDAVERALVAKFGRSEVVRNDKCITVRANTNRVEADVVPNDESVGPWTGSFVAVTGATYSTDESLYVPNYEWEGELLVYPPDNVLNKGFISIFRMHPSCFQETPPPLLIENESGEPVQFDCFPNPTNETLTITYPYSNQINYISIFDILGREVLQLEANQNTSSTTINLNELSSGLYVVSLSGDQNNSKLILKK